MSKYSEVAINQLCQHLDVNSGFFMECLDASIIEIHEEQNQLHLRDGSVLRLRRIERLCHTFNVEVPMAVKLLELTQRVAELENRLHALRD